MTSTPDAYLAQLQALLPPGAAWPRDPELVLTEFLAALAPLQELGHQVLAGLLGVGQAPIVPAEETRGFPG